MKTRTVKRSKKASIPKLINRQIFNDKLKERNEQSRSQIDWDNTSMTKLDSLIKVVNLNTVRIYYLST